MASRSNTELQQRAVSVPLEDIRACPKTILISSGAAKHHATLGALRGRLAGYWSVTSIVLVGYWPLSERGGMK